MARSPEWVARNRVKLQIPPGKKRQGGAGYFLPINPDWLLPNVADRDRGVDAGDPLLDVAEEAIAHRYYGDLPTSPLDAFEAVTHLITVFGGTGPAALASLGFMGRHLASLKGEPYPGYKDAYRAYLAEQRAFQRIITKGKERHAGFSETPAGQARQARIMSLGAASGKQAALRRRTLKAGVLGDWVEESEWNDALEATRTFELKRTEYLPYPSEIHAAIARGGVGLIGAVVGEIAQNFQLTLKRVYALVLEEEPEG